VWLVGLVVVVSLGWIIMRRISVQHHDDASRLGTSDIMVTRDAHGGQNVSAVSAGYRIAVPARWTVEPIGAEDVAVYPLDSASSSPRCKLQFSVFDNAGHQLLEDWIAGHFQEDPTIVIRQTSLEAVALPDAHALRWTGLMDGVKTTLVYIASGNKIYEIAPSSVDANDIMPDACVGHIDAFLQQLQFSK
jgi:hypothetical protein